MVTIRLSRGGAKKQPFYHIVATDSRARRDGRYLERLGYYNPVARGNSVELEINLDRVDYWVDNGAQMSDRVNRMVKGYRKQGGTAVAATSLSSADAKLAASEAASSAAKKAAAEAEKEAAAAETVEEQAGTEEAGAEDNSAE